MRVLSFNSTSGSNWNFTLWGPFDFFCFLEEAEWLLFDWFLGLMGLAFISNTIEKSVVNFLLIIQL
jgi:hypothetical protein